MAPHTNSTENTSRNYRKSSRLPSLFSICC